MCKLISYASKRPPALFGTGIYSLMSRHQFFTAIPVRIMKIVEMFRQTGAKFDHLPVESLVDKRRARPCVWFQSFSGMTLLEMSEFNKTDSGTKTVTSLRLKKDTLQALGRSQATIHIYSPSAKLTSITSLLEGLLPHVTTYLRCCTLCDCM